MDDSSFDHLLQRRPGKLVYCGARRRGEALLLFPDRVTEAGDGQGGFLGRDRLMEFLVLVILAATVILIAAVPARADAFAGEASPDG